MLYTYSFQNKKRDLSDILSTVVKDEPRFISLFNPAEAATQQKHEWLEDQIGGRSITATAVASLACTVSEADAAKVKVGTLLTVKNDPALFRVASVSGTTVTVALVAANGSAKTTPAANDVLNIVSTPMKEATENGDGEEDYHQTGTEWNATQIFRKEIILSGSALAINVYGNVDNQLNRQTAFALGELTRDLNRVVLFGRRVEPTASVKGEAAGLYFFGTQDGGLSIDASSAQFDSYSVNDAAQAVMGGGGDPQLILCNPGQARVLSNEYKDKLQIIRSDDRRGAYVAVILNEINGRGMTIMADPDVPDTDAWILDPSGFGLSNLKGRGITDTDATPKGFDGVRRVALGELTFVFKNAKQRLARIKNLKASAAALAAIKAKA
ncbi:MAG: DUF5309 family protein [Lentisphaeria bacterium]|nr:DUF5309 family protein [Lentisphaeria bacterium]